MFQRHDAAIDLRTDAGEANARMHREREIYRRRAAGQRDDVALRGEAEHLVVVHFELGVLEEFLGALGLFHDLEQLAHPAVLLAFGADLIRACLLLVAPMRGDPVFGDFVHVLGADLHFDALLLWADDGSMDGLVSVRFRRADIVLKMAGNRVVFLVDEAEHMVAIRHRRRDDAKADNVRQLLERDAFALHFFPDGIGLFLAAVDFDVLQPARIRQFFEDFLDALDLRFALLA